MAAAAERRQQNFNQGGLTMNQEKRDALAERRQKDELVGRLHAMYQSQGKDPPIGLASCSVAQLKKHVEVVRKTK
jgi:hypothetical protein